MIGTLVMFCSLSVRSQQAPIDNAEWLVGTWETKTSRGSFYERWRKGDNHQLLGKSYVLKEKDTIILETIRLVQMGDQLYYEPTVKTQNEGLAVRFTCKTLTSGKMTFENKEHDFPQYITYTKIHTDSIVAQISGSVNEKERIQTFPMRRVFE